MPVISKKDFCFLVEQNYHYYEMTIIEAVLDACTAFGVDVESVNEFINTTIRERLEVEAHRRNLHKTDSIGNLEQFIV